MPLVRKLVTEGKSVIVFRETKGEARGCAKYLAEALGLAPAREALEALPTGDPSLSSRELRETLQAGVGFHIADLDPDERQIIEEQFRQRPSTLKILAATTTLAMGVNTPAEAVVIAGLEHPGDKPYSVAEYKNIAGRAGRLGLAERGSSYLVALDYREENYFWTHYVTAQPEDLSSRFSAEETDPRSLMVRVLVTAEHTGRGMLPNDIIAFLEESFGAFLQKQRTPIWAWDRRSLQEALSDLQRHKLVELDNDGLHHLTQLGKLSGISGVEVESVIRVIEMFSGVDPLTISDPSLIAAAQLTVELDQVLFPINKKSTQKEPQTWFSELRRQGVLGNVLSGLSHRVSDAYEPGLRAKKAVACLLWVSGRAMSEIEETMTQFGGRFNGAAGPMRSTKSRTCDVLPTVATIAELLHPDFSFGDRIGRLLFRLELGIPAGAIELATYTGDQLSRGDYLRLVKADLINISALESAEDRKLLECLEENPLKVAAVRQAVEAYPRLDTGPVYPEPILSPYEG